MSQANATKKENTDVSLDTQVKYDVASPVTTNSIQNQLPPEAMVIFRRVSKKHHSLWESLAKHPQP